MSELDRPTPLGSTVGTLDRSAAKAKRRVGDRATLATCFLWHPLMAVLVYVGYHLASHFCLQLRHTGIQDPATLPTSSRHFLRARSSLGQACLAVYHWRKLVLASCLRVYHWLALFRGSVPLASIVLFTGKAAWACQLVAANGKQVNKAGHWRRANTNIAGWPGRVARRSGWLFRRGSNVGGLACQPRYKPGCWRGGGSPGAGLLAPDAQPLPPTH